MACDYFSTLSLTSSFYPTVAHPFSVGRNVLELIVKDTGQHIVDVHFENLLLVLTFTKKQIPVLYQRDVVLRNKPGAVIVADKSY